MITKIMVNPMKMMTIVKTLIVSLQLTRADQATLEGATGCLYPCTYLEYK